MTEETNDSEPNQMVCGPGATTCKKPSTSGAIDKYKDVNVESLVQRSEEVAKQMIESPGNYFKKMLNENEVTGIIFFRGNWCHMCQRYLKEFDHMQRYVMADKGCKIYGVCSQEQPVVSELYKSWELFSFTAVIGDPFNDFCRYVKDRLDYLPELEISDCSKLIHPYLTTKNYPHGAVQAALLFFIKDEPVIGWCQTVTIKNLSGSLYRPDPEEVWEEILKYKENLDKGVPIQKTDGSHIPVTLTCKDMCTIL